MLVLSIIIPVYNTEKYISHCLDTVYSQGLKDEEFEIILVNDGSTDHSLDIIRGYRLKRNNIIIINQNNSGLSAARNEGLKIAKGSYVWFVDSDDFVVPYTIKALLELALENSLDVAGFNLQMVFDNGNVIEYKHRPKCEGQILSGEDFLISADMPHGACFALFRNRFLKENNLQFLENIVHEDVEFVLRAYYLAKRASYYDKVVYNYFQRDGSTMKSNNPKRAEDLLTICDSLYRFASNHIIKSSGAYNFFNRQILFLFSQSLYYYSKTETLTIDIYKNKEYYPFQNIVCSSTKERIKLCLINTSLRLYLLVIRFF